MKTNLVYGVFFQKTGESVAVLVVDGVVVKDFGYKSEFDVASILSDFTGEYYETRRCSMTEFTRRHGSI
jgi:predicted NUDIX family NTP pyrophosphohydrolase